MKERSVDWDTLILIDDGRKVPFEARDIEDISCLEEPSQISQMFTSASIVHIDIDSVVVVKN